MQFSARITIHEVEQGSPEWLELRKVYATASNALYMLTCGVAAAIAKNSNTFKGNFWTRRGHRLESQAVSLYCKVTGSTSQSVGFVTNSAYACAGCSPDGITEVRPIEVKCFKKEKHLSIQTESDIPAEVYAQCQYVIMVLEADSIDLILFHPPRDGVTPKEALKIFNIKRDEKLIQRFVDKMEGFDGCSERGVQGVPPNSKAGS